MIQEHWKDKERLKLEPLTEEEIEKAKNDLKVNFKTRKITKKQAQDEKNRFSIGQTREDVKEMKETFKFHEEIKEVRKNTLLEIGKTVQTMMSKAQVV